MSIVSTEWLSKYKSEVKIIDCSWHMPNSKRDPYKEYLLEHIENAIFFDLDKNSDQDTNLPHMLPSKKSWEKIISLTGISNNDKIVIYDNSDVISSCRCWYNFIYFGHNSKLIHILDGGLKKWIGENKKITNNLTKETKSNYKANEIKMLVKNKEEIDENINKRKFEVIDARSKERFGGKIAEPRKGLRSGSIKNSFCLPFSNLINNDGTFASKSKIFEKFKSIECDLDKNLVFSCGSGVTAAVLAFAYSLINKNYMPIIYDGSWSEYGRYPI